MTKSLYIHMRIFYKSATGGVAGLFSAPCRWEYRASGAVGPPICRESTASLRIELRIMIPFGNDVASVPCNNTLCTESYRKKTKKGYFKTYYIYHLLNFLQFSFHLSCLRRHCPNEIVILFYCLPLRYISKHLFSIMQEVSLHLEHFWGVGNYISYPAKNMR